jgi:hypothetical protein
MKNWICREHPEISAQLSNWSEKQLFFSPLNDRAGPQFAIV